jgi:hypothetical protein
MRITAVLSALFLALIMLSAPPASSAQIRITVGFGPPALPVYEQPICPGDGYIWTPGYWAWDSDYQDYYWVPGTWVEAPEVGYLWTPPWWGWDGGVFLFHEGFWGPHIGFYGGIDYGFGYFGVGFVGGRWDGGHFFYNRDVANINVVNIHNVYNEHVNVTVNRVSYNGGAGGIEARPRPEDALADHDHHIAAVAAQNQHLQAARGNRDLRASVNQGKPPIAATGRPGEFSGHDVVASREAGAPYHPPANRGNAAAPHEENSARPAAENAGKPAGHPNELPAIEHPAAPNTGNAKLDQKYQKQQQKLYDQQNKDRQQLQQKQEQEHQQAAQQKANDTAKQQMEQRHQQQTQQLQQKHTQQVQHLQQKQAPPPKRK